MKKQILILIIGTLSLSSCLIKGKIYQHQIQKVVNMGRVENGVFSSSVPLIYRNNWIIQDVIIHNHTYRFLIDTGAPFTVLSTETAEALGLEQLKSSFTMADLASKYRKENLYNIDSLSIANVSFYNIACLVNDLKHISTCYPIDGILGTNVLHLAVWGFSFKDSTLTISTNRVGQSIQNIRDSIPFISRYYSPMIDLEIFGWHLRGTTVDMGNQGGVDINKFKGLDKAHPHPFDAFSIGNSFISLYGKAPVDTTFYDFNQPFTIGSLKVNNFMTTYRRSRPNLLGMGFLKHFNFIIDWSKNKIYLSNIDTIPIKKISFNLGFALIYDKPYYTVGELLNNSNAQKAGLFLGDTILQINNRHCVNLTKEEECNFRKNYYFLTSDSVNLQIFRKDSHVNISFLKNN